MYHLFTMVIGISDPLYRMDCEKVNCYRFSEIRLFSAFNSFTIVFALPYRSFATSTFSEFINFPICCICANSNKFYGFRLNTHILILWFTIQFTKCIHKFEEFPKKIRSQIQTWYQKGSLTGGTGVRYYLLKMKWFSII